MGLRRALSVSALMAGSVLSLATSVSTWQLSDEQSGSLVLDEADPTASAHVTVKAQAEAEGDIDSFWVVLDWTCSTTTNTGIDAGKVRVELVPDSTGEPLEFSVTTTRFQESAATSTSIECSETTCEEGFTLVFDRNAAGAYDCEWNVSASASEVGDEPPPGATLTVEIDGE